MFRIPAYYLLYYAPSNSERILVEIVVLENRNWVGHFERKFKREWGSPSNDCWHQKISPWAIAWHCLRDPTFSCFDTILACDRHTQRRTDIQTELTERYTDTR